MLSSFVKSSAQQLLYLGAMFCFFFHSCEFNFLRFLNIFFFASDCHQSLLASRVGFSTNLKKYFKLIEVLISSCSAYNKLCMCVSYMYWFGQGH